ncbi:hypothetical protein ABQF34_15490 [Mycolicibacterium boenickei]
MNLAWLVAVIEPDLLAERGHGIAGSPEAELAKVMQGRVLRSVFDEKVDDPSVRAVSGAVQGDGHAVDVLVESLSTKGVRQDGAKLTALTLVACALLTDREDAATSVRLINDALISLDQSLPEVEICRALVLQQRALRNNDVGEPTASDLQEVRRLVDRIHFDSYPELTLRADTGTSSSGAIDNIIDALRSSAAGFDLNASSHDMGYVASDLEDDQLGQFRRWLGDQYKNKLTRSAPTDYGPDLYFVNLRLEAIGHRDVYRSRRELAAMRVVRFMPTLPTAVAADALQLLRLAGADSELRQLVDELVLVGPVSPLLADGRRIESRRTTDRSLRTGELIVLAAAAEVMAPAEAFQALTHVLSVIRGGGPTTAPLRWQADFSKDEEAWIAAAALAGAAGAAGMIARELLGYATVHRLADMASDTVIARIIRRIDWAEVDDEMRHLWLELASEQATRTPISPTAAAIRTELGLQTQLPVGDTKTSLNSLAERINYYLRNEQAVPNQLHQAAVGTALSSLTQAAKEAQDGTYARRVVRPAEIVAVLLTQSPDEPAWHGLLSFLANPFVARAEKSRALEILVRERPYLADDIATQYREGIVAAITAPDRWAFGDPHHDSTFIPALNFAYAYGFLSEDAFAQQLLGLASSPDVLTRRQAGRSMSLFATASMPDWMLPTVYALSSDADPTVRSTVARALSQICQRQDVIGGLAIERLSHLLQSGGVYTPLNALGQLTSSSLTVPQIDRVVRQLRNESQSWRIRKRAAQLTD